MSSQELADIAQAMVQPGKGILAADESTGTIERRLASIDTPSTEDNRRAWRELLFTAPGIGDSISGVILFDETIRQSTSDGRRMVEVLTAAGVIPGIKIDLGAKDLAGHPGETVTEGLDGLRDRLVEYRELGAQFTKWRAVINIGAGLPSRAAIHVNAHALGRMAALSQETGLVPIVEPEVLMDGDHSIDRCFEVTEATLHATFNELDAQGVELEGMVLKPNMVLSGADAPNRASAEEVAEATIACFLRAVPAAVPGIAFLSGGQSDEEATENLDAMNRSSSRRPWELTFSYGRGLQATPLRVWDGTADNVAAAQEAFLHRARVTAAARRGEYSREMEAEAVTSA
jgi:fructose-bisphosphate aldolase class I